MSLRGGRDDDIVPSISLFHTTNKAGEALILSNEGRLQDIVESILVPTNTFACIISVSIMRDVFLIHP